MQAVLVVLVLHEPYKELKRLLRVQLQMLLCDVGLHEPYKELKQNGSSSPEISRPAASAGLHEPYKELKLRHALFGVGAHLNSPSLHEPYKELKLIG